MDVVFEVIRMVCGIIASVVGFFADKTTQAQVQPDPSIVIGMIAGATVLLASGCWAGAIADARRHSPALHFIMGCGLPVVYPVLILFGLDVKGAKAREKAREAERKREQENTELRKSIREDRGEVVEEEEDLQFDQAYFKRIALDSDGNPTGPWAITYNDAVTTTQRIVDALESAVVIQIEGNDGSLQKIRVPYKKITACERAQ